MSEELIISADGKKEKYEELLPQVKALLSGEADSVAKMATVAAALKQAFDFFWVGFYRVIDDVLVLSPFQGPIACLRIAYGKGVCGTAWKEQKTLVVPDVNAFPGHIACSSLSRSEIVVPVFKNQQVVAVLDVDSDLLDTFDAVDAAYLEQIVSLL